MKIIISCCTPYHIFNAINLKIHKYKNEKVDILICNHFNNSKNIFENIKSSDIFENVYYIEDLDLGKLNNKFIEVSNSSILFSRYKKEGIVTD